MRLINCEDTTNLFLIERFGGNIPPYAILSHTWVKIMMSSPTKT
jgi:hypothetical protein